MFSSRHIFGSLSVFKMATSLPHNNSMESNATHNRKSVNFSYFSDFKCIHWMTDWCGVSLSFLFSLCGNEWTESKPQVPRGRKSAVDQRKEHPRERNGGPTQSHRQSEPDAWSPVEGERGAEQSRRRSQPDAWSPVEGERGAEECHRRSQLDAWSHPEIHHLSSEWLLPRKEWVHPAMLTVCNVWFITQK